MSSIHKTLKVKDQGQTVIMMVRETLSHHYTTTYQISLTYLKRQKVIAQTQTHLKNINYDTPSHDYTGYTYIPNIIYLS